MKRIMAMILAGGRVDELKVLTLSRPKSTVPFGGMYRIIDFPLSNLMHAGIEKVGVLSQYHSASLVRHIGVGSSWDMVGRDRGMMVLPPFKSAVNSNWYRGTADAVYQNLDFIDQFAPDLVLILSGDHVYHMDYRELVDYHVRKGADLTAVFKEVPIEAAHRFGIATIDNEDGQVGGRLIAYHEKPQHPEAAWASLTIYLFNTNVLKQVLAQLMASQTNSYEFGHDILPAMVHSHKVYGFKFDGYWAYSRTIGEFWQANMDLLCEQPPINLHRWQVRTNLDHRNLRDRTPTVIAETAEVHNSVIYNGCHIAGRVTDSIIFPGVTVEAGASVSHSIVMFDTTIKRNCMIHKTILDTDVVVSENCQIGGGAQADAIQPSDMDGVTVIGQATILPTDMMIGSECVISSYQKATQFSSKIIPAGRVV
ncbi:MAG: glucose-1-phosphate adenylyltransferase [candidate division KSB1 bacterium]|nr:glucose-1-phosphate adenylyltransferase [candidate division KSB1 bacterium]MDZ7340106.1 glucose-1-phosphate adenylyltransferase [candidate division KSB1 bacterium]